MSYTTPSAPYPQQPPPYGAPGQYNGPYPPAGAYQPPAGAYQQPAGAYPQPYQQQPQHTTVYVYNDNEAYRQQRRDEELAEDCCLLACCTAVLCCCLAGQS